MFTLPPECQQLLISGYVLGNLSTAEALLFSEMLKENPELVDQIEVMQTAVDEAYNPAEIAPPSQLRDRVLAAAEARKTDARAAPNSVAQTDEAYSQLSWIRIVGAALLGIIAISSFTNYRLWQIVRVANETKTDNRTGDRQFYILGSEDLSREISAELAVDSQGRNGTLKANKLPVLPSNQVYALWTVVGKDVPYTTDDKGAILTAVFQVDDAGNFTREIAVPEPHLEPRTIKKIAITIEDIAAPQAHEGSIFISTGN